MAVEVIVAGTPRTGTSFMMSIVDALGFSPGNRGMLKEPDEHNPYGYFENKLVMDREVLMARKLGLQYANPTKEIPKDWRRHVIDDMHRIKNIATLHGIKALKPVRGWMIADIWHDMYPNAKWIYTTRNTRDTHKSRFGKPIDYRVWSRICNQRDAVFEKSKPAKKALEIRYEHWGIMFDETLDKVANHLGIALGEETIEACRRLWKPRKR
jgi:hypothetical protein